ncbi:recombinase family protein [Methylobacterium sp. J-026]|nr:recombinase family protein [Methylobacterium sp. J-026]
MHAFCAAKAWPVVDACVEPCASATDDNRPAFETMIERACDDDHPFDVILVPSHPRFLRDACGRDPYVRRLAEAGVRLISVTEELYNDPIQVMIRQVIARFDAYQSKQLSSL